MLIGRAGWRSCLRNEAWYGVYLKPAGKAPPPPPPPRDPEFPSILVIKVMLELVHMSSPSLQKFASEQAKQAETAGGGFCADRTAMAMCLRLVGQAAAVHLTSRIKRFCDTQGWAVLESQPWEQAESMLQTMRRQYKQGATAGEYFDPRHTCTRRHVYKQNVQVTPVHLLQKGVNCAHHHWPPPDCRRILL